MLRSFATHPERMVFFLAGIGFFCAALAAVIVGNSLFATVAISAAFLGLGALMAQAKLAPIGAAIALVGQAIALTGAFEGHPWQIDSHMVFFALLACLICLRNIPALLIAAGIIAVHHLSLTFVLPSLIYPSGGLQENLGRTVFHAVVVVVETAALVATVFQLRKLETKMQAQTVTLQDALDASEASREGVLASQAEAEAAKKEAEATQEKAEAALEQAQKAEAVRQAADAEKQKIEQEQRDLADTMNRQQAQVVEALRKALSALENGDLTTRITDKLPQEYQALAAGFNVAVQSLEDMVSEVADRAEQMNAGIRDIYSATDDLAQRTELQARDLSGTSEALEGLTKSVVLNTKSVDDVNQSSQSAQASAQVSGQVVTSAAEAMTAIQSEAQEIAKIVEIIEGISFQTNLLALNAGVEAARAGEAGLGFAVVASEVRALAQRSSESATDIRSLIERSARQVENGSQKITETVGSLQTVEATISEITEKMDVISGSTQSQSDGISSLNNSIANLGKVTQRNAALFKETNAACMKLAEGAKDLSGLTLRFRVSDKDSRSERAA